MPLSSLAAVCGICFYGRGYLTPLRPRNFASVYRVSAALSSERTWIFYPRSLAKPSSHLTIRGTHVHPVNIGYATVQVRVLSWRKIIKRRRKALLRDAANGIALSVPEQRIRKTSEIRKVDRAAAKRPCSSGPIFGCMLRRTQHVVHMHTLGDHHGQHLERFSKVISTAVHI